MIAIRMSCLISLFAYAFPAVVFGWSNAHPPITEAAFHALPEANRAVWSVEAADPIARKTRPIREGLIKDYCYYPDTYDCGPANPTFNAAVKPFIYFEGNQSYHYFSLSPPATASFAGRGAQWYVEQITGALKAGKALEAAQFAGAWAHAMEDRVSPYHCLDGFEGERIALEKQHGVSFQFWALTDNGVKLSLGDYKPRLLGVDARQVGENFAARFMQINEQARACMPRYIEAHLKDDHKNGSSGPATDAVMVEMATPAAKLIVDAWYTCFQIAAGEAKAGDVAADLPPVKFSAAVAVKNLSGLQYTVPMAATNADAEGELDGKVFNYASPGTKATFDVATNVFHGGKRSFHIINEGPSNALWAIRVEVKPGTAFKATAWCKCRNVGEAAVAMRFKGPDGSYIGGTVEESVKITGASDWAPLTSFAQAPADAVGVDVFLIARQGKADCEAWFDDLVLTAAE